MRPAGPTDAAAAVDPTQRLVVAHTAGPLLVVGGPGTGKTTALVESVAARVAAGTDPASILVLTFSRRGAAALRDRIARRLPRAFAAEAVVRTFPGYAFGLLRRAAAEQGEPAPRLLTGPEQDQVIRELLAEDDTRVNWPESLRPALRTRAFATQLRDLLLRAVERGVGPTALAGQAAAAGRPDWAAASRFFAQYLQILALRDVTERGSVGYDAAELVRAATALLVEDPALLAAERRRLSSVYVDELAETDPAQLQLLSTVAGGGTRLVAFADPDSSTFAFRGADPAGVHTFVDRFRTAAGEPAAVLTLDRSYRAGPQLLAATRRVAARLRGPARHRLLESAPGLEPGVVEVRTFRAPAAESAYLAQRLREAHLLRGVPWSRMAVILRSTTSQLAPLRRALQQAGVPTTVAAADLPMPAQPAVAPLLLLLRCAVSPERLDESTVVALLHSPLGGADPLAERRLRQGLRASARAGGDRRPSGALLVEALGEPGDLLMVQRQWAAPAQALARLLAAARETAGRPGSTVEDVLWSVWHTSGLADRWAVASARGGERGAVADRDLDAVVALFDTAARFVDRLPGARTEVFLDYLLGQEVPADSIAPTADRGAAVRILTAHSAKGLEWDVVAVVGVQEGRWPDLRLRGSVLGAEVFVDLGAGRATGVAGRLAALLDEERRLFHVAATRAREYLLVTAVQGGDDEEQPSRFLTELAGDQAGDQAADETGGDGSGHRGAAPPGPVLTEAPAAPLTLAALVARLRTVVIDGEQSPARRRAAAGQLARLARAGVRGAHPDQWWGLPSLSDSRPLVDPGGTVTVTPSTVDSVQRCSLRWLLERHGGAGIASPEQGVGNLVHAAAALAADASADRAELAAYLAERFDAIELSARWLAGRERDRADAMLDKLIGWLADNPRRLVAIERDFLVQLDAGPGAAEPGAAEPVDAGPANAGPGDPDGDPDAGPDAPDLVVEIKGRVDRLEIDDDGRLVVVDLKTGRTTPTDAELDGYPQLGAYQAAVEAGAFDESGIPGGAALVQLGGDRVSAREQGQPALADAAEPGWARAMVRRTAQTMAASTFEAVTNNRCRVCPVQTSCPVSGKGRQVV